MVSEQRTRAAWQVVVAAVAAVVVLGLGAFLLLGNLLDEAEDGAAAQEVTDVEEGKVPQEVYDDIGTGVDKDELLAALRPALPVDTRVLARYQEREPEAVGSSCVYYEAAAGLADDLYRFCFVEDQLVDKTVILPDDPGPAG